MNFGELLQSLETGATDFSAIDILLTIILSFSLASMVGWTYQITHRAPAYTQSYVHTLVLMSMVVAIIMLIIGSNIARAFTLVGALSIVRFRNAIKDTRDVGFIFFAMAVGMACGTRFYLIATVATVVICFLMWMMIRFDFFAKPAAQFRDRDRVDARRYPDCPAP